MKHEAGCRDQLVDEAGVGNGALHKFGAGRDRFGPSREEVVEHGHAGPGIDQLPGQGTAHEPCSAGHQDPPSAERPLWRTNHRLTPALSNSAGRNRRHQSRIPRIFV